MLKCFTPDKIQGALTDNAPDKSPDLIGAAMLDKVITASLGHSSCSGSGCGSDVVKAPYYFLPLFRPKIGYVERRLSLIFHSLN